MGLRKLFLNGLFLKGSPGAVFSPVAVSAAMPDVLAEESLRGNKNCHFSEFRSSMPRSDDLHRPN